MTCTEATIPAGGSVTCQISLTVLPNVSDGINIALRATADPGLPGASTALISTAITRVDIEITKT